MDAFLRMVGGTDSGPDIPVTGTRFVIGRGDDAHYRPPSDLVSREHCAIVLIEDEVFIEDLNSRNGTFVNGRAIREKVAANSGDSLRIGRLLFELILGPTTASHTAKFRSEFNASEASLESDQAPRTIDADRVLGKFFDRNA